MYTGYNILIVNFLRLLKWILWGFSQGTTDHFGATFNYQVCLFFKREDLSIFLTSSLVREKPHFWCREGLACTELFFLLISEVRSIATAAAAWSLAHTRLPCSVQQQLLAQADNKQLCIAEEGSNISGRHARSTRAYLLQSLKGRSGRAWARENLINEDYFDSSLKEVYNAVSLFSYFNRRTIIWTWTPLFFPLFFFLHIYAFLFRQKKIKGSTKRTTLPMTKPPTGLEYCATNLQNVWADFNYSFQRSAIPTTQPIVCFH